MKKTLPILYFLLFGNLSIAQIVDDSTKNVYGAKTTLFTTEDRLKNNLPDRYSHPDTTVYLKEKYSRSDASNRQFQHLGFLGSAIFDQRYGLNNETGRTFGFNSYDSYFKSVDDIRYFDTKSPFMDVGVVFGGDNRTKIDFGYSRNVNENWNIGFDINRITADKQIARAREGDRAVESISYDFYSHYKNKDGRYEAAVSYLNLKHDVAEIGGVFVLPESPRTDFFLYEDASTQLVDATSRDFRSRLHLYQQYKLGSGFQLYHQLDDTNQEYKFTDLSESDTTRFASFYPTFLLNSDTTREKSKFSSLVNEVGIKGDIKSTFYRFYIRYRSLIYDTRFTIEESIGETFAGTYLRFDWKDRFSVSGTGEVSNEGFYKLSGELSSDLVQFNYASSRSAPSYLMSHYEGNHHNWDNSFRLVLTNRLSGQINLNSSWVSFSPKASLVAINNYQYIDENQISLQTSESIAVSTIGAKIDFEFLREFSLIKMKENESFRFENEVLINRLSDNGRDFIRIPNIQYSGRLFWRGTWFEDAVPVELGTNLYFRSSFHGNAYDPVISQFYLQNELKLKNYLAVDIFWNMKINNLTTFIKFTHVNQQNNNGYMSSPYFPGQQSILDFGVRWLFFD